MHSFNPIRERGRDKYILDFKKKMPKRELYYGDKEEKKALDSLSFAGLSGGLVSDGIASMLTESERNTMRLVSKDTKKIMEEEGGRNMFKRLKPKIIRLKREGYDTPFSIAEKMGFGAIFYIMILHFQDVYADKLLNNYMEDRFRGDNKLRKHIQDYFKFKRFTVLKRLLAIYRLRNSNIDGEFSNELIKPICIIFLHKYIPLFDGKEPFKLNDDDAGILNQFVDEMKIAFRIVFLLHVGMLVGKFLLSLKNNKISNSLPLKILSLIYLLGFKKMWLVSFLVSYIHFLSSNLKLKETQNGTRYNVKTFRIAPFEMLLDGAVQSNNIVSAFSQNKTLLNMVQKIVVQDNKRTIGKFFLIC